jgi:four helix bundle protein
MNIAQSSLEEVRYYLILARDLNYNLEASSMSLLEEVSRLLESYMRAFDRSD